MEKTPLERLYSETLALDTLLCKPGARIDFIAERLNAIRAIKPELPVALHATVDVLTISVMGSCICDDQPANAAGQHVTDTIDGRRYANLLLQIAAKTELV